MEDMCYERRRAEACVDESAHHALVNAGDESIPVLKLCVFYYCRTYYKAETGLGAGSP